MADKNGNNFICKLCNKEFTWKYSLKQHSKDTHGMHIKYENLEVIEDGSVECLDCNKTYFRMDSAQKHYKDWHVPDKDGYEFICKWCNEEFEVQYSLKQHVIDIHGLSKEFNYEKLEVSEDGNVKCIECSKVFSRIVCARKHFRDMHVAHKNGNKFICRLCNEEFQFLYSLKQHFRSIHGSKNMTKKNSGDLTCPICKKICSCKPNLDSRVRACSVYKQLE